MSVKCRRVSDRTRWICTYIFYAHGHDMHFWCNINIVRRKNAETTTGDGERAIGWRRCPVLSIYPACFFKDDSGYSVVFPDLNWLATSGSNEAEAMEMAVDCLAGYLYMLQRDGDQMPVPSSMKNVSLEKIANDLDADMEGAFVTMVSVDVTEYAREHFERSVRKTLTIPAWLNKAAQEKHINFSQTLQEALLAKLRT